eukprot:TRINITY_DN174_c1_g1_i1.p1 TRINITY_DN174_c1_g1~~TRINITY_DN174_c1_g1_i1.p1  ORF type:complete len:159 (+),score=5.74 TRINITY_DN174_c1_g1_i1:137-613(+)
MLSPPPSLQPVLPTPFHTSLSSPFSLFSLFFPLSTFFLQFSDNLQSPFHHSLCVFGHWKHIDCVATSSIHPSTPFPTHQPSQMTWNCPLFRLTGREKLFTKKKQGKKLISSHGLCHFDLLSQPSQGHPLPILPPTTSHNIPTTLLATSHITRMPSSAV